MNTQAVELSVAIIAKDEELYIGGCLASVRGLANEVIVLLDDRSCDGTARIAEHYGAKVYREPWRGFPAQRNRALDLCQGAWVLFIDADERVTPELRTEICTLLAVWAAEHPADATSDSGHAGAEAPIAGYWIPRHNIFFGWQLRGGGWYPDHQLRLLYRRRARYDPQRLVHELVQLDGTAAYLQQHLRHYNIERIGEFWQKQTSYALSEARTLAAAGRRARWRNFLGGPAREFWHRYVKLGGWRDGALGLFLCAAMAWFEVVKFAFLRGMASERGMENRE